MTYAQVDPAPPQEPNWGRIANHLANRAVRAKVPLPRCELFSLAGLAVAMSRNYYDPDQATCELGVWSCECGWRVLMTLVRDEITRRRHEAPAITFTDLAGARASEERRDLANYRLESALAQRDYAGVVADLLESMTPQQRSLVRMRMAGWTLDQIARVCSQPTNWVRERLNRLRQQVRHLLA